MRPRALLLGADWTRQHADGRGYLVACQGAAGPCDNFWAMIRVTHVREHHGTRYFATMKITGMHHQVEWLVMNTRQGCWQQRAMTR